MFRGDLFALTDLFFLSVNLQHSGFSISSVSIGRLFIINVPRVFSGERIPYFYFSECRGGRNDDASSITSNTESEPSSHMLINATIWLDQ